MEEIKEKIISIINSTIESDAIVIFGSYARGTQTKQSDIDIGVNKKGDRN